MTHYKILVSIHSYIYLGVELRPQHVKALAMLVLVDRNNYVISFSKLIRMTQKQAKAILRKQDIKTNGTFCEGDAITSDEEKDF